MDSQKQQVVERLQQANNILVTVSSNPSVDQLSACIGLTLALNKLGKHATAVFSGEIPSTIEFLQPEKTLEKNTDSLQDFIIALDKSKADKLRYKVEDRMVKIFITPYRTSISDKDLEFSQGDFNVDVVLALGVHSQNELDQAITSHGRILHDATVISINVNPGAELGSINWLDAGASSLSELTVQLTDVLDKNLIDSQIATAYLTGIVAATERFSNQKTSPTTMSVSAELMQYGANQQLVATKLEEPAPPAPTPIPQELPKLLQQEESKPDASLGLPPIEPPKPKNNDGTIEIEHDKEEQLPPPLEPKEESLAPQIHIDEQGQLQPLGGNKQPDSPFGMPSFGTSPLGSTLPPEPQIPEIKREESSKMMTEPPSFESSPITANITSDEDKPALDTGAPQIGLLNREPLPSQQKPEGQSPSDPLMGGMPSQNDMPWQSGPAPTLTPPSFNSPRTVGPASALPDTPPSVMPTPPTPQAQTSAAPSPTLSQIEQSIGSPHAAPDDASKKDEDDDNDILPPNPPSSFVVSPDQKKNDAKDAANSINDARSLVEQAINGDPNQRLEPPASFNAQPMNFESAHDATQGQLDVSLPHIQPQQPVAPQFGAPQPGQPQPSAFAPMTPAMNPGIQQPMPGQPVGPMQNVGQMPGTPPNSPPPMMPPTFPSGQ